MKKPVEERTYTSHWAATMIDMQLIFANLMRTPDEWGHLPDFIQIGVDDDGDWQVGRFDRENHMDGRPVGEGRTPLDALMSAQRWAEARMVAVKEHNDDD